MGKRALFTKPRIVADARMPDAIALVSGDSVHVIRSLRRHDCAFPGCQLSLGHPLPHCVLAPEGGRYQMMDEDHNVLREI